MDNSVHAIHRSPNGMMWFGTNSGVSRYDGSEFTSFTLRDGFLGHIVYAIHQAPDGLMWFGTDSGISCYDGKSFTNFSREDGSSYGSVHAIHGDTDGVMWFGSENGLWRYDGVECTNFTTQDGFWGHIVYAIHRSPDGMLWFGTDIGVSGYDGKSFINFTREDGLPYDRIHALHSDLDGSMWFQKSRYDGKSFANFATEDENFLIYTIHCSPDGVMWFTTSHRILAYDGLAWTSLNILDGLAGRDVYSIHQDPDGSLWFGTSSGVSHYRKSSSPPKSRIVSVKADRDYTDLSALPPITSNTRITIEYRAIDFQTLPEKRQYCYRLYQPDDLKPYNPPTKETSLDWTPQKPGDYIFEVQAIDRDLNYSQPASVTVKIVPPPEQEELRQTRE